MDAVASKEITDLRELEQIPVSTIERNSVISNSAEKPMSVETVQGNCTIQTANIMDSVPNHGISKHYAFWEENMRDYPDIEFRDKILGHVKFGIPIDYS